MENLHIFSTFLIHLLKSLFPSILEYCFGFKMLVNHTPIYFFTDRTSDRQNGLQIGSLEPAYSHCQGFTSPYKNDPTNVDWRRWVNASSIVPGIYEVHNEIARSLGFYNHLPILH